MPTSAFLQKMACMLIGEQMEWKDLVYGTSGYRIASHIRDMPPWDFIYNIRFTSKCQHLEQLWEKTQRVQSYVHYTIVHYGFDPQNIWCIQCIKCLYFDSSLLKLSIDKDLSYLVSQLYLFYMVKFEFGLIQWNLMNLN